MSRNVSRRGFFTKILELPADALGSFIDTTAGDSRELKTMVPEIMADLTPELLAMEAERLGLDPKKDQHEVIRSIQAAMHNSLER